MVKSGLGDALRQNEKDLLLLEACSLQFHILRMVRMNETDVFARLAWRPGQDQELVRLDAFIAVVRDHFRRPDLQSFG